MSSNHVTADANNTEEVGGNHDINFDGDQQCETNDYDNSDNSDEESQESPCLPVEKPTDFNPDLPPRDGLDYLYRVHLESKSLAKVFHARPESIPKNNDQTREENGNVKQNGNKKVKQSMDNSFVKLDASRRIPDNIRDEQIADFYNLKRKIARHRNSIRSSNANSSNDSDTQARLLNTEQPPELANLFQLSQADICHNLDVIADEMVDVPANIKGSWLYSLMALLDEPLESNTYATLRRISRICSHVRSKADCQPDTWTACNLIMIIISDYYKQLDLKD